MIPDHHKMWPKNQSGWGKKTTLAYLTVTSTKEMHFSKLTGISALSDNLQGLSSLGPHLPWSPSDPGSSLPILYFSLSHSDFRHIVAPFGEIKGPSEMAPQNPLHLPSSFPGPQLLQALQERRVPELGYFSIWGGHQARLRLPWYVKGSLQPSIKP